MIVTDSGYASKYSQESVKSYARAAAKAIPILMRELDADTVVVSGNSGISIAHAALMLTDFPLVLCRKAKDNSHGSLIEGVSGHRINRFIVLDDFVSSGATVKRICSTLRAQATKHDSYFKTECVGVLQYTKQHAERMAHHPVYWYPEEDLDGEDLVIPIFGTHLPTGGLKRYIDLSLQ